jgi:hypothetical protein
VCYSLWLFRYRTNLNKRWRRNFKISSRASFGSTITKTLSLLPPGILRLHVSGDFYNAQYAEDWIEALRANPHIKPFGFTRSWRDPEIFKALSKYG